MSNAAASGNAVTPPPRSPRECYGNLRHHRDTGGGMADLHRLIRNAFWFCIGVLLAGVPMLAFAETIPASQQIYYYAGGNSAAPTAQESCTKYLAEYNPSGYGGTVTAEATANPRNFTCKASAGGYQNKGGAFGTAIQNTREGCPSEGGWTYNGGSGMCTRPDCGPGTVRQLDGSCKASCPASGTSGPASGQSFTGQGSAPSNICSGGCLYNINISVGLGGMWSATAGTSAGSTCTTNTSSGSPPEDPKTKCVQQGMAFGTVNGQVVCVSPDSSSSSSTNTKTPDPSKPDAGTGSTTNTTTNTTCTNGSCTTTTTITNTSGGTGAGGTGPGSTSTTDKTEEKKPQAEYCQDNPNSPFCQKGSFSGSCAPGAEPACEGDAVQCAQAKAAWKLQCDLSREPDDEAYKLGKSLVGGGADPKGNPLDPSKITEVNVGQIVAQAAVQRTLSGQCIQSPSFSALGKTWSLDVTLFCRFAAIVGYLMVAASSVIAVRMISA